MGWILSTYLEMLRIYRSVKSAIDDTSLIKDGIAVRVKGEVHRDSNNSN